ncbi:anti-sigma factor domain-containing protein [Aestuariivirga sp.]|uniref:anti-sigma factor n=1 Tax=Aestuariivirga sp. TaxID=2650926 RepID=UPI0039E5F0F1
MAVDDEIEGLAAEYALGTLDAAERSAVDQEMTGNPALASAVAQWERRLFPLSEALLSVPVPAHLKARVMAAIGCGDTSATVIDLTRRVNCWRSIAVGAMALAAALTGLMILKPQPEPQGQRFVAVLQADGPGPAFLASVDTARGTITVRPVTAQLPEGKSYELWALGAGREKPQSLGVLNADFRIPSSQLGKADSAALGATVFAVSLEPEGGSPTGQPTGPVVFTGKLVAAE